MGQQEYKPTYRQRLLWHTFYIGSLVATELNHFTSVFVRLNCAVATKILFESFANALYVKIVRQSCNSSDTLSSVSLLDTNVYLLFGSVSTIASIVKRVWNKWWKNKIRNNTIIRIIGWIWTYQMCWIAWSPCYWNASLGSLLVIVDQDCVDTTDKSPRSPILM